MFFKKDEPWSKLKSFVAAFLTGAAIFMDFDTTEPYESHIGDPIKRALFKIFEYITDAFAGKAFVITVVAFAFFFIYMTAFGPGEKSLRSMKREKLLAAFFAFMYTGGRGYRQGNDLRVLITPAFNLIIALIVFAGFYFLFKLFIRLVNHLFANSDTIFKINTDRFPKLRALYRKHPFWFCFVAIVLSWSFHLFARYPAALGADDWNQLNYYFGQLPYTSWQPIFHTWLYGSFVNAGMTLFGSANVGLLIYRFVESSVMAAVLAYTVYMMHQWRTPFWMRLYSMALYCFTPYFTGNAAWVIKDYPHMIGYIIWTLCIIKIVLRDNLDFDFKKDLPLLISWVYGACFMALCRKNGLHIYIIMTGILAIIWIVKLVKKQARFNAYPLVMALLPLILVTAINHAITVHYNVVDGSIREAFCLPFQQSARYTRDYYDELTDEELQVLQATFEWPAFLTSYDPLCADDIKTLYIEGDTQHIVDYLTLWLKQFFKHPLCYVQATWNQNYFIFMPDADIVVYNQDCDNGKGVATPEFVAWTGIEVPAAMQGWPIMICSMYRMLNQFPLVAAMNNLAMYVYIMFILVSLAKDSGFKGGRVAMIPLWLSLLFVLMSPLIVRQPRYSWAVIYIMPAIIGMFIYKMREKKC